MKNTLLITGGAGYIGSHFVKKAKNNYDIIVVDNFRESRNNIINDKNITYIDLDICQKDKLLAVFKNNRIDIVVHFAALASVPDSLAKPKEYYETNLIGGLHLLNSMVETGVNKIIFSSSASVYGEPTTEIIKEDHPKDPTNPYGYSKLVYEKILKDYNAAYGINSISFRYFCAAGCDESLQIGEYHTPETHVIPGIIETILGKRNEFYIHGNDYPTPDGTGIRDYIHVNDLAEAHLAGMEKLLAEKDICKSFNLGINKGFSVLELIKTSEKITGKKLNYVIKNRRPGDPPRLIADANGAQQYLNWQPRYLNIEEIITTAYNFFKSKL
jgi:UDP-glucose 4-epimerase